MQNSVKFVPFNLKGNKSVDNIVDIGNRRNKGGKKLFFGMKMKGAAAGGGGNFWPGVDTFKPGLGENIEILP